MKKVSKELVDSFISEQNVAVLGVSSKGRGFGVSIYKHLSARGYNVYAVNPNGGDIGGRNIYRSLSDIQSKIDFVITVIPPSETTKVVREIYNLGITKVWMQLGSESEEAINFCNEKKIDVVTNQCIIMFTEPIGLIHKVHRWVMKISGSLPVNS